MYLNQDSIQELQWWFNKLEICNGKPIVSPTSQTLIQSDASKKGGGGGGVLSESVNRGSVISPEVKPPYQCSGIVSHQNSLFNVFENVQSQINSFPSRQCECPFVTDENGRYTKQGDDSHFQRELRISIVQRDYDYCRVPAGQSERQGRLDFQKFPRLKRMATISKSILRNS